ncbi:MAG TPA: acetylornithine deacetylase [Plasticicumulans sp.]|nr:acetylornithine deacetylase [Plasticicumulans sp.]
MPVAAPDLLSMIRGLVALPSVSAVQPTWDQGNLAVVERLADWLEALGFRCELLALDDPRKANLVATLGSGPGGLVLAGHTDTVPYDSSGWRHDPFGGIEADGRIYGLGTADMKSFLALAAEAARGLRAQDLRRPLVILATADEESSMDGARALVAAGRPRGRHAVIGEPTGLKPIRLHKGVMMEAIRVQGRAGHASDPSLGNSALEGMHRVIGELLAMRAGWATRYRNPQFAVEVPTLNLGHIHGGDNPNRICAHCELHIDIRPLPGMCLHALREEIDAHLARALEGTGLGWSSEALIEGIEPFETPADSRLVAAAEQLTGHTAGSVAFGTEGPYLNKLGMDTIILGPGDIAQAHQPDEYLALDRIPPTLELLRALIRRFCIDVPDPAA